MGLRVTARPVATFAALLLYATNTQAETLGYAVDTGIGASDNISLVPTNKVSQTLVSADMSLDLQQQRRLLAINAQSNLTYLDFVQGAYRPELVGRFDGLARLTLLPERLTWVLRDNFGQEQINPFVPVTPNNRENINYLSTGPDLVLRFGPLAFIDANARYIRTVYETSPYDSNRFSGSTDAGLALSAHSSLSVAGTVDHVLFVNTALNTDFDRNSEFLHYSLLGGRTEVLANLGATEVNQGSASQKGPLAKFSLWRRLSATGQLSLSAGRDLTDASTSFSNLPNPAVAVGTANTAPAALSSTNYAVTYGSAAWEYLRGRTKLRVSGQWEKDAYDGLPLLDLHRDNAQFSAQRQLTRELSVELLGTLYKTTYANVNFDERDQLLGGSLTLQAGRGLEIRLRYYHVNHTATGGGTDYAENRAFLTVGYHPREVKN